MSVTTDLAPTPALARALADLEPADVLAGAADPLLDTAPDGELTAAVAHLLTRPRAGAPSSFVLHSGLELLARSGLLPHVAPDDRRSARRRIVWLGAAYVAAAPAADPVAPLGVGSAAHAATVLAVAIDTGDEAGADAAAAALVALTDADELIGHLSGLLVPSLAAAAHGPIFLHLLARTAPRTPEAAGPLRGLARALAMRPGEQVTWPAGAGAHRARRATADLEGALAAIRTIGRPESSFILPLVRHGEATAETEIGPFLGADTDLGTARRAILRVAARSMLFDDPADAPYGWSHALTIPQAMLAVAHRTAAPVETTAIAATVLVACRAVFGTVELPGTTPSVSEPSDAMPCPSDLPAWSDLAAFASAHEDAHLVKYTLACMDAARTDPAAATLYRAAAAHLADWWRAAA